MEPPFAVPLVLLLPLSSNVELLMVTLELFETCTAGPFVELEPESETLTFSSVKVDPSTEKTLPLVFFSEIFSNRTFSPPVISTEFVEQEEPSIVVVETESPRMVRFLPDVSKHSEYVPEESIKTSPDEALEITVWILSDEDTLISAARSTDE